MAVVLFAAVLVIVAALIAGAGRYGFFGRNKKENTCDSTALGAVGVAHVILDELNTYCRRHASGEMFSFATLHPMRKEELDRRCAEIKERMLSQGDGHKQNQPSTTAGRKSATKAGQDHSTTIIQAAGSDVNTLRNRIARLEAENRTLRQQVEALTTRIPGPSGPANDSAREQQRNFFKYSNVRRY